MSELKRAMGAALAASGLGFGVDQIVQATHLTVNEAAVARSYEACAASLPNHQTVSKLVSKACRNQYVNLENRTWSYPLSDGVTVHVLPPAEQVQALAVTAAPAEAASELNRDAYLIGALAGIVILGAEILGMAKLDERRAINRGVSTLTTRAL